MHASLAIAATGLAALAAASPAGVTSAIAPSASSPPGCQSSYDGTFMIEIQNATKSISKRDSTPLVSTLKNGVLTDAKGRTGYIASNDQFQYDGPPQAGAKYTAGFSVCANNSLALGGSTIFYKCLSGTFYNLYDTPSESECSPIYIQVISSSATTNTAGAASQLPDGQVTAAPVTQIGDGQIQANTKIVNPVTQIGDGQIQAPTAIASPVTQISDGQIQAPKSAVNPVTQISDGQIQAGTATASAAGALVTQIADGQIQASNATVASQSPVPYTGAASTVSAGVLSFVGLLAVLAL